MKNLTPSMLLYSFINYMAKKVIVILALGNNGISMTGSITNS